MSKRRVSRTTIVDFNDIHRYTSKMNYIITMIFTFCFSFQLMASNKPYIISGFDDVLRQAENTGLIKAAIKILEPDATFAGMPELYRVISVEEQNPKFVLVSAISHWFDGRIERLLTEAHYPEHRRYLRNWLTEWSIEKFKIDRIKEIIAERPDRNFIVIFDNSDASLELANSLSTLYPKEIKAIYLRQVVNKKLPQSATSFYTAFDIALSEYTAGRMTMDEVVEVAAAILLEKNPNMLFPSYAFCPISYSPCDQKFEKQDLCLKIEEHVQTICLNRGKM